MSHILSQFPAISFSSVRSLFSSLLASRLLACLLVVLAVVGQATTPVYAAQEKPKVVAMQKVNINKASADAIADVLNGVGIKRAKAIVEWREKNGPFTDIKQLLAIKGIGEKVLAKNAGSIVLK